jgi:YD repeat-containing protein
MTIENPSIRCVYDGSGNLTFYGEAAAGKLTSQPNWAIKAMTYDGSGNLLTVKWAAGNAAQDKIWDNYASLTYL